MRNIGLLLLILFITATAQAQVAFEAGLNMANLSIKNEGTKVPTTYKKGVAMGLIADMHLGEHIFFHPGLLYEMGGCTFTNEPKGFYYIDQVEVPLNIEYKSGEKCGSRFFVGIGPSIIYNLGGSIHFNAYAGIRDTSPALTIGPNKIDDLKKRGWGMGLNIGYQIRKHFYFRFNYLQGISNIKPVTDAKNGIKSSEAGIHLGYTISRCSHKARSPGDVTPQTNHWRGLSKGRYSRRNRYALKPW